MSLFPRCQYIYYFLYLIVVLLRDWPPLALNFFLCPASGRPGPSLLFILFPPPRMPVSPVLLTSLRAMNSSYPVFFACVAGCPYSAYPFPFSCLEFPPAAATVTCVLIFAPSLQVCPLRPSSFFSFSPGPELSTRAFSALILLKLCLFQCSFHFPLLLFTLME